MMTATLRDDALALCGVLLEELETRPVHDTLRSELAARSLDLLDYVTVGLTDPRDIESLADADDALLRLRSRLRLAVHLGLLDEAVYLSLLEQGDAVGRQLGGLLKHRRRVREGRRP